jgi:hypothetical protein
MSEPITVERLERALALCAYLVELDGPIMVPMFERIERDLAALRTQQDATERAKKLLMSLASASPPLLLTSDQQPQEG